MQAESEVNQRSNRGQSGDTRASSDSDTLIITQMWSLINGYLNLSEWELWVHGGTVGEPGGTPVLNHLLNSAPIQLIVVRVSFTLIIKSQAHLIIHSRFIVIGIMKLTLI